MSKDAAIGFSIILLLVGGIILLGRRSAPAPNHALATRQYGDITFTPIQPEPQRYRNKETRRIEYNEDGLPTLIEITRDYAIT